MSQEKRRIVNSRHLGGGAQIEVGQPHQNDRKPWGGHAFFALHTPTEIKTARGLDAVALQIGALFPEGSAPMIHR